MIAGAVPVRAAAESRQLVADAQAFAEHQLGRPLTDDQRAAFARGVLTANQEGTVLIAVVCPPIKDLAERGAITLAAPPPLPRWPLRRILALAAGAIAAGVLVGCAIGWCLGTLSTLIGAAL